MKSIHNYYCRLFSWNVSWDLIWIFSIFSIYVHRCHLPVCLLISPYLYWWYFHDLDGNCIFFCPVISLHFDVMLRFSASVGAMWRPFRCWSTGPSQPSNNNWTKQKQEPSKRQNTLKIRTNKQPPIWHKLKLSTTKQICLQFLAMSVKNRKKRPTQTHTSIRVRFDLIWRRSRCELN